MSSSPNNREASQSNTAARSQSAAVRRDLVTNKGGSVAGVSAGADGHAFVHVAPRHMPLPVLIAVPHAGRVYPSEIKAQMRDIRHSQLRLEDRLVDTIGVEVARATGTGLLVAHAPRAMIDLNRAADDIDWGMVKKPRGFDQNAFIQGLIAEGRAVGSGNARSRSGLGLVPRRLPGFGEIWRSAISTDEIKRRVDQIHRPYHDFLSKELIRIRDAWGAALLIDLHSMPPLRRRDGEEQAPRIVLGDRYGVSCDSAIASHAFNYLEHHGCVTAHNRPYSGGYVLDRHARPARGIHAIQVEICRSTYLDATYAEASDGASALVQLLAGLVRVLGAETAGLASGGRVPQAAE